MIKKNPKLSEKLFKEKNLNLKKNSKKNHQIKNYMKIIIKKNKKKYYLNNDKTIKFSKNLHKILYFIYKLPAYSPIYNKKIFLKVNY